MDGSAEESGWEGSSSSRGVDTACVASSAILRLVGTCGEDKLAGEGDGRLLSSTDNGSFRARGDLVGSVDEEAGDISLREWLDKSERSVDLLECLHIFRQIVEAVSLSHSQGIVVGNVRPSCFVMTAFNRVSFIESASCSSLGSDSGEERTFEDASERASDARYLHSVYAMHLSSVEEVKATEEEGCSRTVVEVGEVKKAFPLKEILLREFNWYTSPEEAAGGPDTFASDIYRLGVLLFELFCTFDSLDEKLRTMSHLRHRVLPPQLLLKWPKDFASFCLRLLHPEPNTRPKMSEVLQSEFLNEPRGDLEEREAAIKLREKIEDQELLLEFLLRLHQRKQEIADKFHDTVCLLSADIEEVLDQQGILKKKGSTYSELEKDECSAAKELDQPLPSPVINGDSACSGSRKRSRSGLQNYNEGEFLADGPRSETHHEIEANILSKRTRLMKNFKKLEAAYFSTRYRMMKPTGMLMNKNFPVSSTGRVSIAGTEGSSIDDLTFEDSHSGGRKSEWINPLLEGLCKYLSFSKLKVRAHLKQGDLLSSSNLVCSLGFDRDKEFFATAGVNRKIKVFEFDMILNEDHDIHYPVVEMASRSKLSSLSWNSYIKSQIASSDFEGVVQLWDVTRSQVLMEMREHEKRVWSVDFSLADPTILASGSDDGAVKLWSINQSGSIGTIKTKANVCSVQFPPDSGRSLAIGSADHTIYCYDLRSLRIPCCTLIGHMKTVSYVKYLDSSSLVSASTDSSLKLWDLSTSISSELENPLQTFTGHTNVKNFVGLSISDGYIATGSETNEVFVYHKALPMPVLSYRFNSEEAVSGREVGDATRFVSCVCWRGQSTTLVAANSSGDIKIMEMV